MTPSFARLLRTVAVGAAVASTPQVVGAQQSVQLPGRDRPLEAVPAPLFTLGRADGTEMDVFSDIASLAFDDRDNLYVLDRGNSRVVVFDRRGDFVRQLGRAGGGPGEFGSPRRMTVTRGGDVVVSDFGRQSFSVFGADGEFRESVAWDRGMVVTGPTLLPHPRGGVIVRSTGAPLAVGTDREPRHGLLWYPLRPGTSAMRLATVPAPSRQAFAPEIHVAALPDGDLVVANSPRYALAVVDARHGVERIIRRDVPIRQVSESDREREIERRLDRLASGRGASVVGPGGGASANLPAPIRSALEARVRNLEFAEVIPAIQDVVATPSGALWIQRAGETPGEPGPIDVVSPEGRYVGTLAARSLPAAFSAGGLAAHVVEDELGVQRIVVSRVPAAWR